MSNIPAFVNMFLQAANALTCRRLANYWSPESSTFSMCGTHLVIKRDFPPDSVPLIIPCTEAAAGASTDVGQREGQVTIRDLPSEIGNVRSTKDVTLASVSGGSTEVTLSRKLTSASIETVKILAIPRNANFEGLSYTALPPGYQGDTFKVSLDLEPKRHYSLVNPSPESRAAVIERHPAFVKPTSSASIASMARAINGRGRLPLTDDLEVSPVWVACDGGVPGIPLLAPESATRRLGEGQNISSRKLEQWPGCFIWTKMVVSAPGSRSTSSNGSATSLKSRPAAAVLSQHLVHSFVHETGTASVEGKPRGAVFVPPGGIFANIVAILAGIAGR